MRDLTIQERTAMEAVARHFAATWEKDGLTVARKHVAVHLRTLPRRGTGHGKEVKPRLRFDKVVLRLMERLQGTLGEIMPEGTTVLLTVTAPIRLALKTAAALEEKIHTLLQRESMGRDEKATIQGNRVHIRLLRNQFRRAPRMIGFVHNPGTDTLLLFNMTGELLELAGAESFSQATKPANNENDEWLVLITARGSSCLEAYRYIYSQLPMPTGYQKVLMVFGDGSVETLCFSLPMSVRSLLDAIKTYS